MSIVNIEKELTGSILDIGGGGDAVIGRVYRDKVICIDNMQEELDEAPDVCKKMLMDAEKLDFDNESFDNVTFFFSLMYMTENGQKKAIEEACRVLKTGGKMCIWDAEIESAYPDPFIIDLEITSDDLRLSTTYGIGKYGKQSKESISEIVSNKGLTIKVNKNEEGFFYMEASKM